MSRRKSSGAHVAVRTPRVGFIRRNLSGFIVLGVVLALVGPSADAANGDPLVLGEQNYATSGTYLATTNFPGIWADTASQDPSDSGIGGHGNAGSGVEGISTSANGVEGRAMSSAGSGVYGWNAVGGAGVTGRIYDGGVAVLADDPNGTGVALRTTGKLQFQKRSSNAVVTAGQKSKTVTLPGVTENSRVLATVQRAGGYFVQAAVPAAGSFTIFLNKAAPAGQAVPVGYLVIN